MASKTIVLVTGANTGLGYEIVKSLMKTSTPYHIFVAGRSAEKVKSAIESLGDTGEHTLSPLQIDLESDESIASALKEVQSSVDHIDVLVNNAGANSGMMPGIDNSSWREIWNKDYDVNVTGTYVVTETFIPLLLKSSNPRLLFVTSGLSSLAEANDPKSPYRRVPPAGWPKPPGPNFLTYRSSKAALNMLMQDYTRVLENDKVKVWGISPGVLTTGLGGQPELLKTIPGALHPSVGGEFIRKVIEGERDADVGKVIRRTEVQLW